MRRRYLLRGLVVLASPVATVALTVYRLSGDPILHTVTVGLDPQAMAVDAKTGRAFVATTYGAITDTSSVRVLDAGTGALLRIVPMDAAPRSLLVDPHGAHVFVTFFNNPGGPYTFASVLDAGSGTILRTIPGNSMALPIALAGNLAGDLFALEANAVSVLDVGSGTPRRTFPTAMAGGARAIAADSRTNHVFAFTDCCENMLQPGKATILYHASLGTALDAAAVDEATGRVFVSSLGSQDIYGNFTGSGTVIALDARTGRPLHTTCVGRYPNVLAVDERTSRLFVANRDARSVSVLDARSGVLLRTIAMDLPPIALAVDEPARHLLILTGSGAMRVSDRWGWLPGWLRRRLPFVPPHGPSAQNVPSSLIIYNEAQLYGATPHHRSPDTRLRTAATSQDLSAGRKRRGDRRCRRRPCR